MKRSRRIFSRDFKLKAVRYANSNPNVSIAGIAKGLEIDRQALWSWIKEVHEKGEDHAFPGSGRREPRLMAWIAHAIDEKAPESTDAIRAENEMLREKLDRTIAERDAFRSLLEQLIATESLGSGTEEGQFDA